MLLYTKHFERNERQIPVISTSAPPHERVVVVMAAQVVVAPVAFAFLVALAVLGAVMVAVVYPFVVVAMAVVVGQR